MACYYTACNLQVELDLSQLLGQAKASVYIKATANAPIARLFFSDTVDVLQRYLFPLVAWNAIDNLAVRSEMFVD